MQAMPIVRPRRSYNQPVVPAELSHQPTIPLARHEGWTLFSAAEAVLKGALEADTCIELIAGPRRGSFTPLLDLRHDEAVSALLARHGTALLATPDAARAIRLAAHSAVSGHRSLALVANDEIDLAMAALRDASRMNLDRGGAMAVIFEDDPWGSPATCPRQAARRLGMPCVEPAGVEQTRVSVEHLMRLSRAARRPVAMVVHRWILRSSETLEARPNRVLDRVAAAVARPRRRARWAEQSDVLHVARRLELNRMQSAPNPGELLPVGFVVVGPALDAINHVVHFLHLHGRVPVLQLGLINPIDESVVQRMLGRCHEVIVLEPRPGSVQAQVLLVAEAMRQRDEHAASVTSHAAAGSSAAEKTAETAGRLNPDEALHPSILSRKIVPLLHMIRPGLELPFVADPPPLATPPPPRGETLGDAGALVLVRQVLADVDQWLRDREPDEPGDDDEVPERVQPTTLAIDGSEPEDAAGHRVVTVETWTHRRFLTEGIGSLRQAAWDDRPWLFVVCVLEADDVTDVERLARAAIPVQRSESVRIEVADLNRHNALRDLLREVTPAARLTVIIARDGPPPRFDITGLEQAWAEIDQLGYEPRQRIVHSVESACAIRRSFESPQPQAAHQSGTTRLHTQFTLGPVPRARRPTGAGVRIRLRPLFEAVEVVRDRPPASAWDNLGEGRLEIPRPIHGGDGIWRAHLAGFRGELPGVATQVLCDAGRIMGYHVKNLYDPTPIGPGRRAWAQVMFTRPRPDKGPLPITGRIPYGEANLLLGPDRPETLRAVDPAGALRVANLDRTYVVSNLGAFGDEPGTPGAGPRAAGDLRATTRDEPRLIEDVAAVTRSVFHTDRVTDLVLVGAAFQLGLLPLSLEALDIAVQRIESKGFGRAREALSFGRRLAVDRRIFARPRLTDSDDVDRVVRRTLLLLRCGWKGQVGWGGAGRAGVPGRGGGGRLDVAQFADFMKRTLRSMPGLSETDAGRQARRDLVVALHRCLLWGGLAYARRYADLVTRLYRSDRGDTGRAMTRYAILPLAEAMLIRDPVYVATVATSPGHRRRARRWLNVKASRGDRLQRRFLTRLDIAAFGRRLRLEVRTSDWIAWLLALLRHRIPQDWRGTAREREIRALVINVVEQATGAGGDQYERWCESLQRVHDQAVDDRLRGMALSELRMLIEPEG